MKSMFLAFLALPMLISCGNQSLQQTLSAMGIELQSEIASGSCAEKQYYKFSQDFYNMNKKQKLAAKEALQNNVKKIILKNDEVVATDKGEVVKLNYVTYNGYYNTTVASKIFNSQVILSDLKPAVTSVKTGLENGSDKLVVTVQTQVKLSEVKERVYYTKSVPAYDEVESFDMLVEALKDGKVVFEADKTPAPVCGAMISLNDLVKAVK
jgi:hypothetical protein